MSLARYLVGLLALAAMVAPVVYGAVRLRTSLVPGWSGAPARLAEAIIGLTLLIVVAELLGTVGLFRLVPVAAACFLAGFAADRVARRVREGPPQDLPCPRPSRIGVAIALAACALVVLGWAQRIDYSLHSGMIDADTLWYHMPSATRFVQESSVTQLNFTSFEPLTTFYPENTDLVHALGILALGRDLISPLVNLGWAALALLAAWCVGRPRGVGPATLMGGALVVGIPIMVGMQAGTAKDDVAGVALILAAAAILVNGWPRRGALVVAGAATGLALGVKLSVVPAAVLLAVGVLVALPREGRRRLATAWIGTVAIVGCFWYLRNLVRVGNPFPWVDLSVGPVSLPRPRLLPYTEEYVKRSLADYVGDGGFWGDWLVPAAENALGPAWWAVVALAVAGGVAAVVAGDRRIVRVLGAVALLSGIAYVVLPGTAGGSPTGVPHLVMWSMRYATVPLVLGLVLLPLARPLVGRPGWPLAAFGAVLVATQFVGGPFELWSRVPTAWAFALALVVAAAATAAILVGRVRLPGRTLALGTAAAVLLAVIAGWRVADVYLDGRYVDPASPFAVPYAWARDVSDARIGIAGFYVQYPLYGEDLSNRVRYVGHSKRHAGFESIESCRAWRRAVNAGRFQYIVISPFNYPWSGQLREPPEMRWMRGDPAVREIARGRDYVTVFRVSGPMRPDACSDRREPPGNLRTGRAA